MSAAAPRQAPLVVPFRPALGREDFLVTDAAAPAVATLDAGDWPEGRLALTGPEGAGKSHLAAAWAAAEGAALVRAPALAGADLAALGPRVAVDDADRLSEAPDPRAAEVALFHLLERARAAGGAVLLCGRDGPARWPCGLRDLATRLAALSAARLPGPDDGLLVALLAKLFADRQTPVAAEVPAFLARRIERSGAAALAAVDALDAAALAARRARVTVPFAREVLFPRDDPDAAEGQGACAPIS